MISGSPEVDGLYVRDGEYDGVPLFKKGQLWLLRYRMRSSGDTWWYIADKDQLDVDDGDYYRVKDDGNEPPVLGWTKAKDGVEPLPTLTVL